MTVMVYLDAGLRVQFVNRQGARMLGCTPRDLVGRALGELVDPGTLRYALAHLDELGRGPAISRDYVLRHKRNGELRRVRLQAVADRNAKGATVGYLACSAGTARRMSQAAAHELRTPLASVIAALDLLQDRLAGPDTTAARRLREALEGAERLAAAVEKWLDEPH